MKKFKKLMSFLLALCIIAAILPVNVFAASNSGKCGDNVTWKYSDGTLTISGTGKMWDYDYDDEVYAPWTESYAEHIKKVVVSKGVTSIGNYAFADLYMMESISIGNTVTTIGYHAFYYCTKLTSITIPDSVTSIGHHAFYNCSKLAEVKLSNNLTTIADNTFDTCESLVNVTIPDSVTSIGELAFIDCTSLVEMYIPDSVTSIGLSAFLSCANLEKVRIGSGVTKIDPYAFLYCPKLKEITVDKDNPAYSVGSASVLYNKNKTHLVLAPASCSGHFTIPNTVRTIGTYAFGYNWNLTGVTIPDSVTTIEDHAFALCNELTNVNIPNSVTTIGDYAFFRCEKLESVTIPGSVDTLGFCAFSGCIELKNLTLNKGIKHIGEQAFLSCSTLTNVVIPNSVISIGEYAFEWCTKLTSITIPGSVESIGIGAFFYCNKLENVTIQNGVKTIHGDAFFGCTNLNNITIPASVTSIGDYAFMACTGLNKIYFRGNAPAFGESVFAEINATAYYPAGNSTWTKSVKQNYGGSITWKSYVVKPDAPVIKAENVASSGKIKLTWDAADDAVSYKVYRATSKGGSYSLMKTTTGTSYTNTSAEAGTTYYYKVKSVDANGTASDYSNIVFRTCDLAQPKVTVSNVASSGKIKISWEKIDGAVKYELHRATSKNGTYTRLTTVTGTSVTNNNTIAGKTYYYKVKAIAEDSAANSAFSEVKSRACDLAQPEVTVSNVASSGKIKISWAKVDGAVKYEVYRATSKNGTYSRLTSVTGTSVTNTSTTAGKTYYYKVKAIAEDSAANSVFSSVKSRTCDLARPTAKVSLNSSGKPIVSWSSVDGAVKYKLYIYDANGNEIKTSTTTGTRLTHSSAVNGKTYSYRVVAVASNTEANSAKSSAVSIKSK